MDSARTAPTFSLRLALAGAAALIAILALTGALASAGFTHPTTIKYLVTVAGSAGLVLVATAREPLRALVGLAVVVAPFNFVTTVAGLHITPLIAVDVLAVLVWVPRSGGSGSSALRWIVVAFALAMIPGIVVSSAPGVWTLWLAVTLATGCLAYAVARKPGGVVFVVQMIVLSGLVQAGLALWELRSGHLLNLYQQSGAVPVGRDYFFTYGLAFRPAGALPDPIGLGQVLALCVPVTVALGAQMRRWQASAAVLALAGLAATALVLSLSRMSMIGGVFGIAGVVVLLPRHRKLRTGWMLAAMVAAVTAVALTTNGHAVSRRVSSIFNPTSVHVYTAPGDLTRERIWSAALQTAEANAVSGVGFGDVARYLPRYGVPVTSSSHAHDTYLQFFAEGGILGLLGLLAVMGAAGADLVRGYAANRVWVAGAAGALIATLVSWVTDVEVRYMQVSAMVAILLGLIAAMAARGEPEVVPAGLDHESSARRRAQPPPTAIRPLIRGAAVRNADDSFLQAAEPRPEIPPRSETPPRSEPRQRHRSGTLAIVFVSHHDGGAERYVRVLARAAVTRGWSVHAAFPALPGIAMLRADLTAGGVICEALAIPTDRPRSAMHAGRIAAAEALSTLRWLRRVRPSATLTMLPHPDQSPGIVLASALHPARSVAIAQLVPPSLSFGGARRALYSLCRRLGQQWVAVSADNRDHLAAALGWSTDTIDLVYNGVSPALGAISNDERTTARRRVREELGLGQQSQLLVTVGRLDPQKGYDVVADAIPAVVAENPDARWLWVGDGPGRPSLVSRLMELGISDRVRLLGYRKDVPRLLAAADLFVLASRCEGAPFAVLEAFAMGLPVVVSDAGPFRELVTDGVEGRIVPAGDPSALAAATSWMLSHADEFETMGRAARQRVLSDFSEQHMIDQTLTLLTAVPHERRASRRRRPGSVRRRGAT
ncbi:MAG: glycosyltransferase [Actinomycetota bacterium]|nr:glycosyltransferase [Actinomycetota bacterium]